MQQHKAWWYIFHKQIYFVPITQVWIQWHTICTAFKIALLPISINFTWFKATRPSPEVASTCIRDNVTKADDHEAMTCIRRKTLIRAHFPDLKTGIVLRFFMMLTVAFFINSRTKCEKRGSPRGDRDAKLNTFPSGFYAYNKWLSRQSPLSICREENLINFSRLHYHRMSDYLTVSMPLGSNIGYKR